MTRRILAAALLWGLAAFLPPSGLAETSQPASQLSAQTSRSERFRRALGADPGNLHLRYNLGVALLLEGIPAEAVRELQSAYPAFADSIEMNFNLGIAHSQIRDADSALLYLERAEELGALEKPEIYPLADTYYNLAIQYWENGNDAEAERIFRKVLQISPQRLEVRRHLGDLLSRGGKTEAALQEFATYLAARPDDPTAREYVFAIYFNRALGLLETAPLQARENFVKARQLVPENPLPLYYLGYLDYARADMEGAVAQLSAAFPKAEEEVRQSIRALLHNCALNLLRQRKSNLALEALAPLLAGPAPQVKDLNLAGSIHLSLKQYSEAYRFFDQALALDPANKEAMVNRLACESGAVEELVAKGQAAIAATLFDEAQDHFERAQAINPADPRPAQGLEAARASRRLAAEEQFSRARDDLRKGQMRLALEKTRAGLELDPGSRQGRDLEQRTLKALEDEISAGLAAAKEELATGRLAEARQSFSHVLELAPENPDALAGFTRVDEHSASLAQEHLEKANQALAAGQLSKARTSFGLVLKLQPGLAAAESGLARLEAQVDEKRAEAMRRGRKALEEGRFAQAREYFQAVLELRDDEQVRAELNRIEQTERTRVAALVSQAEKARERQNFREARTLYAKALKISPETAHIQEAMESLASQEGRQINERLQAAERQMAEGNFPAAIAGFRRVLELDSAQPAALQGLEQGRNKLADALSRLLTDAASAMEKGALAHAEASVKEALGLDPFHAQAQAALARLEQMRLAGIKPGDEERLYLQGIEFYTRGRYEEAIAAWEQVLTLSPGHEKARMNIEKAMRKLKQIREYGNG